MRFTVAIVLGFAMTAGTARSETAYRHGVVAADHPVASRAGLEMLEGGGNAVDAAVATSFALSVVRPYSCGIGGGGMMLIHAPGRDPIALDYREQAPLAVGPDYYENLEDSLASRYTAHGVGTPGTVAGLLHALERYGTLPRDAVLAPAIRIAEEGFAADAHTVTVAGKIRTWVEADPARRQSHRVLWERFAGAGELAEGDTIRNPEQARALRLIARDGAGAFYDGPVGRAAVATVERLGGPLRAEDLRAYRALERPPLAGSFRGRTLVAMPPPSNGGVATIQVLGIIEEYERLHGIAFADFGGLEQMEAMHVVVEAMKHAFADRARWFADPDAVEVPTGRLLDRGYLRELAARVDPARTLSPDDYGSSLPPPDDGGTSHFCVIDEMGMAVSGTETINLDYGSRVLVEEYGFFLNNEMDDFTTHRGVPNYYGLLQSDRNLPAPGKRPLSSMTPTILVGEDGAVDMIVGGSGGPRIITATIQTILHTIVFDLPVDAAVERPRFHHQWMPDELAIEDRFRLLPPHEAEPAARMREAKGHRPGTVPNFAAVQAIKRVEGGYAACSDPRKGGRPAGR